MGALQITHRPILVLCCHYGGSELLTLRFLHEHTHIIQHIVGILLAYSKSLYFR